MKEGKIWGETLRFFAKDSLSAHLLRIQKGGYCSEHRHQRKINFFFIISGRLQIQIWRDDRLIDKTILCAGDTTYIYPGDWHQFEALEDAIAIEIYFSELEEPDIERRSEGGMR